MESRRKTQQAPPVTGGLFPSQVSTSLELSFVGRDKIEKLKLDKGIRSDVPVSETQGSGLEKRSKIAGKSSSSEQPILKQRQVVMGLQRFYRKPLQRPEGRGNRRRKKNLQGSGRWKKLITHLQRKIKGTRLPSDLGLGQVLWGTVTS